ncbi:MAG TPA: glycosyltransferase [Candidatus Kapabacteria bacterium]|nr:glycosyltransferase [Candidatus Kapabacteria bacterium]HPU23850.1 glycosyltransferase [Candidatus Kapabacteria bacterium]
MHYRLSYEPQEKIALNPDFKQIGSTRKQIDTKLSLIIPTFQEEKLLEEQLKRFSPEIRKKYNFELIVSDGGSTDKTVEIAKKYADKIVLHDCDKRQTIAAGRNNGASVAIGDVLVFLNADSYPADLDKFFSEILAWANDTSDCCGAIACYVSGFPSEIRFKDKVFYFLHNQYVAFLNFIGLGMGRGECQIVRRSIFEQVGGYNNEIVAGEDFDLYRRINKVAKVKFCRNIVVLESTRRFRKYGYFKTLLYWGLNAVTVMLFNKSITKEWEAVR